MIVEEGVAKLVDRSVFAGSVATADRLVRTMVGAGISLVDAVYMITASPARIMRFADRGTLSPGARADFTLFDDDIRVAMTVVGGRVVYEKKEETHA